MGSGKFQSNKALEERKKTGEGLRKMLGPRQQNEEEVKMSEALAQVASEHGIESVTAVALAYVMAKAPNVFPLVDGRKVEHLYDNIQALKLKLTSQQIEHLESVRPLDPGFPNNFIGQDPRVSGQAPLLLASNAPLSFVQAPKPIGIS